MTRLELKQIIKEEIRNIKKQQLKEFLNSKKNEFAYKTITAALDYLKESEDIQEDDRKKLSIYREQYFKLRNEMYTYILQSSNVYRNNKKIAGVMKGILDLLSQ